MPSPTCTVNATSTLNGVDVTPSSTVTIALADLTDVAVWSILCVYTDELQDAATITAGLTIDPVHKTATFTAPAAGSALIFRSQVNQGKNANGVVDPTLTTTFGVYTLVASTIYRVGALNEVYEGSAAFGTVPKINAVIRGGVPGVTVGAGLTYTGGVIAVGQNADSSILVNAHDVQLNPALYTSLATPHTLAYRDSSAGFAVGYLATAAGVVATAGQVRGQQSTAPLLGVRNAANSANIAVARVDTSDNVLLGDTTNAAQVVIGAKSGGNVVFSALSGAVQTVTAEIDLFDSAFSEVVSLTLNGSGLTTATLGTGTTFTLTQPVVPSTGATPGNAVYINLQPGQAQTGSADNNHGGSMIITTGAGGTGGSGAPGDPGVFLVQVGSTGYGFSADGSGLNISGGTAFSQTALSGPPATGFVIDCQQADYWDITLTHATTDIDFANWRPGQRLKLSLKQGGGNNLVNWPSVDWGAAGPPVLDTVVNLRTIIILENLTGSHVLCGVAVYKGFQH